MQIVIGFSKSNKKLALGSDIIRWYMGTKYSHIYVRIPKEQTNSISDTIYHASAGMVHGMSKTQFDKKHVVIEEFVLEVDTETYNHILLESQELCGADYGLLQNLGIVLVQLLKEAGLTINNPFISGWNCSEFVAIILLLIHYDVFKELKPNICTPKDIYLILKAKF